MSTINELNQKINLIRHETEDEGNTRERVARTFELLRDLDIFMRSVATTHPQAEWVWTGKGDRMPLLDTDGKILADLLPAGTGGGANRTVSNTWNDLPSTPSEGDFFELTENDLSIPSNVIPLDDEEPSGIYLYDGTNWIGKSNELLLEEVLLLLGNKMDTRMSNLATDLTDVQKAEIHDKLFVQPIITSGTTIKFDKERDYGFANPIDSFSFDLTNAKRGNIQYVYFNGIELPNDARLVWLNDSDNYFENGVNYLIELEFKTTNLILANLIRL